MNYNIVVRNTFLAACPFQIPYASDIATNYIIAQENWKECRLAWLYAERPPPIPRGLFDKQQVGMTGHDRLLYYGNDPLPFGTTTKWLILQFFNNDPLAGHTMSPSDGGGTSFVRSTAEIFSLLEGGGEIGTDVIRKEEENGFVNDGDKSQGHEGDGLEGRVTKGCGGGAAAPALPLKTHKEERGSSSSSDDYTRATFHHETDDEVITMSTSVTSDGGLPTFGISRQVVVFFCHFYFTLW